MPLRRKTTSQFVEDAQKVHGDRFNYSEVEYVNTHKPVRIKCRQCGVVFMQEPASHLAGHGCPNCGKQQLKRRMSQEAFIEKCKAVHGNRYDYSRTEYRDMRSKVLLVCPRHGEFRQRAQSHILGNGSEYKLNTFTTMAKVKYYAKENTKLGTHSFYAVPVPNGTLTFNEVCEEACRNTSIEPSIMKAAVAEYMKTVQSNVLKGFRVPVGEQFITVYPNLNAFVKDTEDKQGNKTVATAKMLTANKGRSRLGASVSIKFSQEFASNVSWQKIDERTGAEIPDEDIIDGGGDSPADGGGGEMEP